MTEQEKRDFYEECMECRVISYGTLEHDFIDAFYNLIDEYAERKCEKLKKQIENMRNCANCNHSGYNDANGSENCGHCHIDKAYCILDKENHDWTSKCDNWKLDENLKNK